MELNVFEALQEKLKQASPFHGTIKFVVDGEEVIFLDGQTKSLTRDDKPADCTIHGRTFDLMAILQGQLNPVTAFMTGRIQVDGALNVAMQLTKFL